MRRGNRVGSGGQRLDGAHRQHFHGECQHAFTGGRFNLPVAKGDEQRF